MAGFFSSNSTTEEHQQPKNHNNNNNNNNNWEYLSRNHESSSTYYHYNNMDNKEGTSSTYESWQPQPQSQPIYHSETVGSDGGEEYNRIMMMRRMSETSGSGSGSGTISCQDCGNQAKKDCEHMRCRTCCKSRGFDCATHVKSTWIPASVRRHRHHNHHNNNPNEGQEQLGGGSGSNVKRRRDNNLPNIITSSSSSLIIPSQLPIITTPAVTTAATATTTTSYGMELGNFPAEVSSSALFRCVRVSSMNDSEDEVAYQTAVRIGGHVFKGILYDQGPADNQHGPSTSGGYGSSPLLNLTPRPGTSTAGIVGGSSSALGYIDPSLYPAPLSPFMPPGTQFFPNPRP